MRLCRSAGKVASMPSAICRTCGLWSSSVPGGAGTGSRSSSPIGSTALTPKGVAAPVADARYDLNGNNEASWKDVKVLQQFYGFYDGDVDMDDLR